MNTQTVMCRSCGALNRVPAERLGAGPKCGKCGHALFAGKPIAADAATFDRLVGKANLPVLVDFWAAWCGPCKAMAPAFEGAAAKLEPKVMLAKLDTEQASAIAQRYSISSIPTLILFRGGREVARQSGAMTQSGIVQWTNAALG